MTGLKKKSILEFPLFIPKAFIQFPLRVYSDLVEDASLHYWKAQVLETLLNLDTRPETGNTHASACKTWLKHHPPISRSIQSYFWFFGFFF